MHEWQALHRTATVFAHLVCCIQSKENVACWILQVTVVDVIQADLLSPLLPRLRNAIDILVSMSEPQSVVSATDSSSSRYPARHCSTRYKWLIMRLRSRVSYHWSVGLNNCDDLCAWMFFLPLDTMPGNGYSPSACHEPSVTFSALSLAMQHRMQAVISHAHS